CSRVAETTHQGEFELRAGDLLEQFTQKTRVCRIVFNQQDFDRLVFHGGCQPGAGLHVDGRSGPGWRSLTPHHAIIRPSGNTGGEWASGRSPEGCEIYVGAER